MATTQRVKREREYNAFSLGLDGSFSHCLAILAPQKHKGKTKSWYVARHNESSSPSPRVGGV